MNFTQPARGGFLVAVRKCLSLVHLDRRLERTYVIHTGLLYVVRFNASDAVPALRLAALCSRQR